MLAISPLRNSNNCEEIRDGGPGEFGDFSIDENFLDYIDFSEPFAGFDGDSLPDLEVDPSDILVEFSAEPCKEETVWNEVKEIGKEEGENYITSNKNTEDANTKEDESTVTVADVKSCISEEENSKRKSSATGSKNSQGKKKVKVDWTPELHRRFVQAVEQLGIDKAVPSRILELMGIDCLTRHNVASHLQKYRSHRKHLQAREAEAASWNQRRQMYSVNNTNMKKDPWLAPTIGFPPPPPPPAQPQVQTFRPLHVWGHPHPTAVDPSLVHTWPRHLAPRSPLPPWPSPPDPAYWHHHYQFAARESWTPHTLMTQGTPYFPQPLPTMRFPVAPVPGILPHPMYRPVPPPPTSMHSYSQLQLDSHPSKESIDAAIGDVLKKPWSSLPLGLKPPSVESVIGELQRQGVSQVPPTCVG